MLEKEIKIISNKRTEFIDITDTINSIIKETKVQNGICYIFVPHTTAGVTINENADPSVVKDIITSLNDLIPENGKYSHSEGNSDAHIKASIIGQSLTVFISENKLKLGTWQGIYFCEFDGPRHRTLWIKIVKL